MADLSEPCMWEEREMSQSYPSIFNDVIGPVMRGPSSSHCAAAVRIGRIVRDLMDGEIEDVQIAFDPDGSLATTHASQGSDMGLFGGLLGWDTTDERLVTSPQKIKEAGINVSIRVTPRSMASCKARMETSSSVLPQFIPPMAQAPNPMVDTTGPLLPNCVYFMFTTA